MCCRVNCECVALSHWSGASNTVFAKTAKALFETIKFETNFLKGENELPSLYVCKNVYSSPINVSILIFPYMKARRNGLHYDTMMSSLPSNSRDESFQGKVKLETNVFQGEMS